MKKVFLILVAALFCGTAAFAQLNLSVDLNDEIYGILDYAQLKGYCSFMSGVKPYTAGRILDAIDEILEHEDQLKPTEIEYFENFKKRYTEKSEKKMGPGHVALENGSDKWHMSFLYDFSWNLSASGGVYNDSSDNSFGFDLIPEFNFNGDITKYLSYNMKAFFDLSYMPIKELTEDNDPYLIGYYWYDKDVDNYCKGRYWVEVDGEKKTLSHDKTGYFYMKDDVRHDVDASDINEYSARRRTVKKFKNNSYLPYTYHKPWSGQFYLLSNMSASGLEGWATEPGISGGITAEMRASLINNKISIGAGRNTKEWAGMDNGSSLVLNANAQPFFEVDSSVELLPWLHFSSLVGILEYPNQDFINDDAYSEVFKNKDEATVFQNAFSINMIDLDFKYFHFDFGTNAVWPKRFEIGYMFPLLIYVEYQNHIGDYDNMALFGDVKFRYPGIGSVWASIYLDEINGMNNDPTKSTRAMFAGQLGAKSILPFLPGATISARYTKVEPFCYTHNSVNYTPWYDHYISTAYVNNGEGLGYYLDPNSDEFFLRLDFKPTASSSVGLQYQLIRHGADYGSQQVPGSSYYSELAVDNRDDLEKFFLRDGAYNWMNIINLSGSIIHKTKKQNVLEASANIGFLYSCWTVIDSDKYDRSVYGNNGNCKDVDKNTEFKFVDNDEYPIQCGVVFGAGLKIRY